MVCFPDADASRGQAPGARTLPRPRPMFMPCLPARPRSSSLWRRRSTGLWRRKWYDAEPASRSPPPPSSGRRCDGTRTTHTARRASPLPPWPRAAGSGLLEARAGAMTAGSPVEPGRQAAIHRGPPSRTPAPSRRRPTSTLGLFSRLTPVALEGPLSAFYDDELLRCVTNYRSGGLFGQESNG